EVVHAAENLPEEAVEEFLDRSALDPEVREIAVRMLHAAGSLGGGRATEIASQWAAGSSNAEAEGPRAVSLAAGSEIGRYVLLKKVGGGGMGEVWLAGQKEPVQRQVALKLIKAGWGSREVIARFQSERQALALMDHPGIAKVFDAGATAQ